MVPNRTGPISAAEYLTVAVLDAAVIAIGILVGWLLDRLLESAPLLSLLGFIVGLLAAVAITWTRLLGPSAGDQP